MIFRARFCLIFVLLLGLAGCDSGMDSALDEQKDANYLNGCNRRSSGDHKGAAEEFSKALRNNPDSASAHFELALINETPLSNYAAAIYHYEEYLRLRPDGSNAENAKGRIRACKTELVKSEFLAPVNQGMQRDLERLSAENLLLKRQIEGLQLQLSTRPFAATPMPTNFNPVPNPPTNSPNNAEQRSVRNVAPSAPKTHTVKAGETVTSIASKYNVKLNVFLVANPKVDPRRLKVGQTLTIPSATQ